MIRKLKVCGWSFVLAAGAIIKFISSPVTTFLSLVTRQESWEDSDLFKSQPTSDVDALGKKRYVGKQK